MRTASTPDKRNVSSPHRIQSSIHCPVAISPDLKSYGYHWAIGILLKIMVVGLGNGEKEQRQKTSSSTRKNSRASNLMSPRYPSHYLTMSSSELKLGCRNATCFAILSFADTCRVSELSIKVIQSMLACRDLSWSAIHVLGPHVELPCRETFG
jgi:hypothetical protein